MPKSKPLFRLERINPELVLMGVRHGEEVKKASLLLSFRKRLRELEHLMFEASQVHFEIREEEAEPDNDYELAAFREFEGQKHFLDEDADYEAVFEKLGVSAQKYGVMMLTVQAKSIANYATSAEEVRKRIQNLARDMKWQFFGLDSLDTSSATEAMHEIVISAIGDEELQESVSAGAASFVRFFSKARDHNIYAPGIRNVCENNTGKKGALLGALHLPVLKKLLTEETETVCPSWPEYVADLPEETRRGIKYVEQILQE